MFFAKTFSGKRLRAFGLLAIGLSLALPVMLVVSSAADARAGRGGSFGSRGSRTFAPPPMTKTAPNAAQPMQRTITPPNAASAAAPAAGAAARGGMFSRGGMLGGLAAGFLGAGLLGMLFGGGFLSGLGSFASILGLIAQVVLVVIVARLAINWWRRRNAAPAAGPVSGQSHFDPNAGSVPQSGAPQNAAPFGGAAGAGFGAAAPVSTPIEIVPDDYDAFERLLGDVQVGWSKEDVAKLETMTTPEMGSYFAKDFEENKEKGIRHETSDVKLLQGDLAEAWREGVDEFATVALRFSMIDKIYDRTSGNLIEGDDTPVEATEIWTFLRPNGGAWELAAIQQA